MYCMIVVTYIYWCLVLASLKTRHGRNIIFFHLFLIKTGLTKCIARAVCAARHVTKVALFCISSLLCSSNCVWAAEYEAGQSVSTNRNEESTGENCHLYNLVVNAISPYSCTIKLQYILLGDYWECVRPARLPVLTRVTSSILHGNNIWDTFLVRSATDTTEVPEHFK